MSLQLKEKVAGIPSSHLREDFPPHPDDPPRRKIKRIVPYPPLRFKGGRRNLDVISRDEIHLRIRDERTRRELEGETSPEAWESKNEALRRLDSQFDRRVLQTDMERFAFHMDRFPIGHGTSVQKPLVLLKRN